MTGISGLNVSNSELIQQTGSVKATGVKPSPLIMTGQVDASTQIDTGLKTPIQETKTKRSETELYNTFKSACREGGFDPSDTELTHLIMFASGGKTPKELLNVEQSEINRYQEALKAAVKDTAKKTDGSFDVEAIAQLAQKYNVVTTNNAWSIEGYKKNLGPNGPESITQKMNRFYTKKGMTIEEKVDDYFTKYYKELSEQKIKEGSTFEQELKRQEQDIYKMIAECSVEEIPLIRRAILRAKNTTLQGNSIDAMLAACDDRETRSKVATETLADKEYMEALWRGTQEKDSLGQTISVKDYTKARSKLVAVQTGSDRAATREQEYQERLNFNKQLEAIEKKVANGEELTKEEQEFLEDAPNQKQYYQYNSVSEHVGTANSYVLTNKEEELAILHANELEFEDAREVYIKLNDYVTKNADALNIDVEEFNKMMNEATNGNYDIILNDAKNGTLTELNEPLKPTNNEATTQKTTANGIEPKVQEQVLNDNQKQTLEKSVEKDLKEATIKALKMRKAGDSKGADAILLTARTTALSMFAKNGYSFHSSLSQSGCSVSEGIVYAYEQRDILPTTFIENAKQTFKDMSKDEQVLLITAHPETFMFYQNELRPEATIELSHKNISSYVDEAVEESAEIIEEQKING